MNAGPDQGLNCLYPFISFQIWKSRIRRSGSNPKKDDFNVTGSTKVCSKHFLPDCYVNFSSKRRALKTMQCQLFFLGLKQSEERLLKEDTRQVKQKLPLRRSNLEI